MKEIEMVDGRVIVSSAWICENMEVSRTALAKWVKQGCPRAGRGKYDLLDVLTWRGVLSAKGIGANHSGDCAEEMSLAEQKIAAEIRIKRAQANLGEMKNAVASGKYVLREELEIELNELFSGLRRAALALPRRVSGLLVGHVGRIEAAEIERQCETLIRSALTRMSEGNLTPIKEARRKAETAAASRLEDDEQQRI